MLSFKPKSIHHVAGRGTILTCDTRIYPSLGDVKIGDFVKANGLKYQVTGVEKAMKLMAPPIPDPIIGIVVKEVI